MSATPPARPTPSARTPPPPSSAPWTLSLIHILDRRDNGGSTGH
nr:hypothetical protein [Streptomyces californicus]